MKKPLLLMGMLLLCLIARAQYTEITGHVKNQTDSELVFQGQNPELITNEYPRKAYRTAIDKNGNYKIKLKIRVIEPWLIKNGGSFVIVELIPNTRLTINIDSFDVVKGYNAVGQYANDLNFSKYLNNDQFYDSIYKQDYFALAKEKKFGEILEKRKICSEYAISKLQEYNVAHPMSANYLKWKKSSLYYNAYYMLMTDYPGEDYRTKSTLDSIDFAPVCQIPLDDNYAALNIMEYNTLVARTIVLKHFNYHLKYPLKNRPLYEYAKRELKSDVLNAYLAAHVFIFRKINYYDSIYPIFKRDVGDTNLINIVENGRNEYLQSIKDANNTKENILKTPYLKEIFEKYKGKAVYVDFWASWCGPCRSEMQWIEPIKKKYADKDVVFLYLAYNDQKPEWLKAIKDLNIKGEHFLLSSELMKDANKIFNIQGIPRYALIDKEGNIIDKSPPRPSQEDQLIEAINKLL